MHTAECIVFYAYNFLFGGGGGEAAYQRCIEHLLSHLLMLRIAYSPTYSCKHTLRDRMAMGPGARGGGEAARTAGSRTLRLKTSSKLLAVGVVEAVEAGGKADAAGDVSTTGCVG